MFATWFTCTTLVGTFIFVGQTTRLTRTKCLAVAVATTVASRLLVAAMKLPLVASGLTDEVFHAPDGEPLVWISAIIASAAIGTATGGAVLAGFGQRVTRSGVAVLFVVNLFCVSVTFSRIVAQLVAHPPEA